MQFLRCIPRGGEHPLGGKYPSFTKARNTNNDQRGTGIRKGNHCVEHGGGEIGRSAPPSPICNPECCPCALTTPSACEPSAQWRESGRAGHALRCQQRCPGEYTLRNILGASRREYTSEFPGELRAEDTARNVLRSRATVGLSWEGERGLKEPVLIRGSESQNITWG